MGGNQGDVLGHLAAAREALAGWSRGPLEVSPTYVSEPWGRPEQPEFQNQVVGLVPAMGPWAMLDHLQALERSAGRTPGERWGPRPLDLDLLCWGDRVIDTPRLSLPHPRLTERRFVLAPWADVAPEFVVPGLGRSVAELLAACPDPCWVRRSS